MEHTDLPPKILVETWLFILTSGDEQEARRHVRRMLNRSFGGVEFAAMYLEDDKKKMSTIS
ncbi:hypothetical protein [Paraglaciecola sp. L3A3]|uniref:hypothetical protein n=1 Tax=Paraglaciecola sp. L3A3 TaxID=2686358 RepID=UPI00131D3784|nr:hypothetical protein [Paraglaciecola sp. L3A3]